MMLGDGERSGCDDKSRGNVQNVCGDSAAKSVDVGSGRVSADHKEDLVKRISIRYCKV